MPTPTTANRGYQKPDPANKLNVDVLRLAAALDAIDADIQQIRAAAQTISGAKTFAQSPIVPTVSTADNSDKAASTAYVKAALNALLDGTPGALDTLNELAAALGDDPNFAATVTTALAAKASQTDVDAKFGLRTAIFTTAGAQTWTCPAGVTRAKVTVIGGGGTGGSSGASGAGGGGGGGGTAIKYFSNLVPGTTYNLTVAAQGAASTFVGPGGVTPTGNGGANGSGATIGAAGAGGTAIGGDLNLGGEGGQAGVQQAGGALSGRGGSSTLGGGGRSVTIISGQNAGVAGTAPGAGGGGAAAVSGTNQAGGAGQPGAVIIEY
jgi:hypothetical protein